VSVPQAAYDAARARFAEVYNDPATMTACIVAAVEAAAPHIAGAERERIRQLAVEHGAVYAASCELPKCPDGFCDHPFDELLEA
jgi:hypothetical protein